VTDARPVVVVDVDSLRPDHVGAYGHPLPTTPTVDRLAERGVTFERAYAASTPCIPSRAGLLTGRYAVHHGVATHGAEALTLHHPDAWAYEERDGVDPREWQTLPEACYRAGVPTGAVSTFPRHPAPWFVRTWHRLEQPREPPGDRETFATVRAADAVDRALSVLDDLAEATAGALGSRSDGRFLLYLQLWDPHFPYRREPTARFRGGVDRHPHPTEEAIAAHGERSTPAGPDAVDVRDRSDLDRLLARYDAEIRHADDELRRLVEALERRDLLDPALVVVTGDHGEAFGERGVYRHHWSVHEPTQRVPLVVKPPADEPRAAVDVDAPVTNVDVAPTVLDYLGVERPARWQGRSLRPAIEGDRSPREAVVLEHGLQTAQRAVVRDDWKLVRTLHPGEWGEHLPETALYDLGADPHERENVADEHPTVVADLTETAAEWVRSTGAERLSDPLATVAERGPAGHRFRQWWADR